MNEIDDSIVEKVWDDLDGQVPRAQIRRVVAEITLGFQDAPVKAFVPIFIHRRAVERLKQQLDENELQANGRLPVVAAPRRAIEPSAKFSTKS